MRFRRVVGAVLAVLTMHVSVSGASAECVRHAHGESAASNPATHGDAMRDMPASDAPLHAASHAASHAPQKPCDEPAQSRCCTALTSCSTVFTLDARHSDNSVRIVTAMNAPGASSAPRSEITTPDPPPPRS